MTTMTIKFVDRADDNLILVTDYDYERKLLAKASISLAEAFYQMIMAQDEE